jgi:hypothetical protein
VTVVYGAGQSGAATAPVTVAACFGTPVPPDISFTFTNDASVATAAVGDTVDYSYCGENTSEVDLEVVRVVDDRFGVLELAEAETLVSPGETLCNTDLGLDVSYKPVDSDAGSTVVNNAVVTVRTVEAEPQEFQAADPAEVEILGFQSPQQAPTTTIAPAPMPVTGASGLSTRLLFALIAVSSGAVLVLIARRRTAG